MPEPAVVDDFHLARARSVAVLGRAATAAGVAVIALVTVPSVLPAGGVRMSLQVLAPVVIAAAVALICLAARRLVRPPVLLRADDRGMQVHALRGAGLRSVAWSDVRAVRSERLRVGSSVIVEHQDGRCAVIPHSLVDEGGSALARVLRTRLDAAHGQRRL